MNVLYRDKSRGMTENEIDWQYQPHKYQYYMHQNLKRYNAFCAHRRFGKTIFNVNECLIEGANKDLDGRDHAPPRYALIYPELKQGKSNAWEYLKYYSNALPRKKNESELWVKFKHNGAKVQILGADKPDRIRGEYFDGVAIDEYAMIPPGLWEAVIRPTLSDYKGWVIFSGTPKGRNHFYDICERAKESEKWFFDKFTVSETGLIDDEELEQAKEDMSEAKYAQEYECSFNDAVEGAYFRKNFLNAKKEDRITSVPYEASHPVDTAWDLGVGDATAIWFYQMVGREIRLIDYEEDSGEGLTFYFDICRQKPYSYNNHYAPWDIEVRELSSGRTRKQIARKHGFIFQTVDKVDVKDRIEASRSILSRCYFDEDKCKEGIEALQHYRKEWDEKLQKWRDKPLHDWASHAADAFGYMAVSIGRPGRDSRWGDGQTKTATSDFSVF